MNYQTYINSPRWRKRRREYFSRHPYACSQCGTTQGPIELHHLTYEWLGNEEDHHLLAVCRMCHGLCHGKRSRGIKGSKRVRRARRAGVADG